MGRQTGSWRIRARGHQMKKPWGHPLDYWGEDRELYLLYKQQTAVSSFLLH